MNWDRLLKIDRRIIYLVMSAAIILPLLFPMKLPMGLQKMTKGFYDTVDQIDTSRQCLMISIDYTPQTEAENHPMTIALLRHAFARKLPVLMLSLYPQGVPLGLDAMEKTMAEFNEHAASSADSIVYGRDVVFLGWQPPPIIPILGMGRDIAAIYPTEPYRNLKTADLPLMKRMHNYDQVGVIAAISSGSSPMWFVQFAQTKFGVKVGAGTTAVSTADYYPYFETRQLCGMLGGMKGAAEYENLLRKNYHVVGRARAMEGMGAQSAAHLLIIAFVVIGNVAYFANRRKKTP